MRISLNWLRELVDVAIAPEELAETLTMAGFEVEEIEDRRTWADGVVLGKIVADRQQHPECRQVESLSSRCWQIRTIEYCLWRTQR